MSRPQVFPKIVTDELREILSRQAASGSRAAVYALIRVAQERELIARTGCRYACAERGVSTYCGIHYSPAQEVRP